MAGRTQSPYFTRETLVAAALVTSVSAGTVQFGLPRALLFDNTGNAVQSLTLDFNDGSAAATLLPGGAGVYKSYPVAGEYVIQFTAHFANGSSKVTFTRLLITGQASIARGSNPDFPILYTCNSAIDERVPLTASIPYTDYDGRTYAGVGAVTTYFANCNNRQLTKPVIMLDGIEFGGPNQRVGIDVYSSFLNYYEGGIPKRLGEELRTSGNDVLILDFPDNNGAEYIQRNAFVLIQLIQNVNADLRSRSSNPEKLTIIGPSMSGLVSRYALAYMEKKFNDATDPATYQNPDWNHNTRLWMAFDSPQLGANIPIGDQKWLRYYAEVFESEAAEENTKNLDAPASKEMLVHHYRSPSSTVSGAPGFRDRFQAELDNLGMPTQPRRISVSNGSLTGVRQDWLNSSRKANGCDKAFWFEAKTGNVRLFYIPFLTIRPLVPTKLSESRVFFSPDYGQTCLIFDGSGFFKSSRREFATGRSGSISYDVAPGGWRDTQATLAGEGTATNQFFEVKKFEDIFTNIFLGGPHRPSRTTRFYDVIGKHCFIPTVSALALTNPNRDLGQNLSTTDLVCSGETPFDSYFAPAQNEDHVTITAANALYIKKEIGRVTPTPVFTAAPTAVCPDGGTAQFSVVAECTRAGQPSTAYAWTAGSGLVIASGQGTATVTVQSVAGFIGTSTLQVVAIRTGYTASAPATAALSVGGNIRLSGPSGLQCYYSELTYYLTSVLGSGQVVWHVYLDNVLRDDFILTDYSTSLVVKPTSTGHLQVEAVDVEACSSGRQLRDATTITIVDRTPNPTPGGIPNTCPIYRPALAAQPAAYPNPADTELTLTAPETAAAASPRTAVLYSAYGREVRRTRAGEAQVSTAGLPSGLYYLMVAQNGRLTRSQIRVQH